MTLSKNQKEVYDWLLTKPGYIKKSTDVIFMLKDGKISVEDINVAKKKARIDYISKGAKTVKKPSVKRNSSELVKYKISPIIRTPLIKSSIKLNPDNVLVIGDTHFPFDRDGYLDHCAKARIDYKCGTVVHIGDVVDNSFSSFHEVNPDGFSAGDELAYALARLAPWYKEFKDVKVCLGNHDLIINRKAHSSGLSKRWIKGLAEVLEVPSWQFDIEHEINNVLYTHGTGTSGAGAAFTRALQRRISVVQGHLHSEANIRWNVSNEDIIFGMQVGAGVDDRKYAFDYATAFPRKFIVSCGLVLNKGTLPVILPMKL